MLREGLYFTACLGILTEPDPNIELGDEILVATVHWPEPTPPARRGRPKEANTERNLKWQERLDELMKRGMSERKASIEVAKEEDPKVAKEESPKAREAILSKAKYIRNVTQRLKACRANAQIA